MSDRKPTQARTLERWSRNLRLDLRTAIPGEVVTYDAPNRRARVQACTSVVLADGTSVDLPPIPAAPVIFPRGGGFSFVWPLNPGDTGILVVTDRALDRWLQTGECAPPRDGRTHAISDAVFLPGLVPDPLVDAPAPMSITVSNGQVEIDALSVKLGSGAAEPVALATSLITAVDAMLAAGVIGDPTDTGFTGAQTAWNSAKAAINASKVTAE